MPLLKFEFDQMFSFTVLPRKGLMQLSQPNVHVEVLLIDNILWACLK